ncbi:hypothetical protein HHI36_021590 [Cryptolaemus montrouzieri]|uniref:DEP domain-containing protein n=1 Tax=Cryptolaemus montrouzieri TaxID=559131 RepID=A0ABD2MXD7_9CUCU
MEENIDLINSSGPAVDNLYPALTQCFVVILCGYFAGRMNWVSETEAKGMNMFVGTFSLPSLIFMSLVKLDLSSVNWMFLLSILVSKSIVFFTVLVITLLVLRPLNLGRAGIFAIFCTQSNDFAIGYPLVEAVYKSSHPDYVSYLYLVAPINLAILNPIAFILMEIGQKRQLTTRQPLLTYGEVSETSTNREKFKMVATVVKNIFLNPIVFMTILGVIGNVLMRNNLPVYVANILDTFGSAFSASALFLLGIRMVGKVHTLRGATLVVPGILIMVKLLAMPLVTREVVSILNSGYNVTDTVDLSMFGFLYGTFPSAPAVFVFATQYTLDIDLIASSMVACTFLSAPLMFVSAKMITLTSTDPSDYMKQLDAFTLDISIIGTVACLWVLVMFGLARKITKVPHNITTFLLISQLISCVGAILWNTIKITDSWPGYFLFAIFIVGVYSSRLWTTILAITLLFLQCRSLCFVIKLTPLFVFIGFGIPVILSGIMVALNRYLEISFNKSNPNFVYGRFEAIVSVTLLVLCFIVTCGCLILHQRYHRRFLGYQDIVREVPDGVGAQQSIGGNGDALSGSSPPHASTSAENSVGSHCNGLPTINEGMCEDSPVVEIEDLFEKSSVSRASTYAMCPSGFQCQNKKTDQCQNLVQKYQQQADEDMELIEEEFNLNHDPQIMRHMVLLILLLCSMFVGLALCVWTLFMKQSKMSGIYIELSFLDATLNFGQSIIIFGIFGLNTSDVALPCIVKYWRQLWYGADTLNLPAWQELTNETKQICEQFITHHLQNCKVAIASDKRWRIKIYRDVFTGHLLVDWLINVGLARDRGEAVNYARHLVEGRVLKHINSVYHFYDRNLLYTFV